MAAKSPPPLDEGLKAVAAGDSVDWLGSTIPAARVKQLLTEAVGGERGVIILLNAAIEGDLQIDEIGQSGAPLTLEIVGCTLGTFRARASRWRQLVFAKSGFKAIDLPGTRVEGPLLIDTCRTTSWIELRGVEIGGMLSLSSTTVAGAERGVILSSARIGQDLMAVGITVAGCFQADRVRVAGNVHMSGALLDGRKGKQGKALDLSRAQVEGQLELVHGARRFTSHGRIHLDAAELGSLVIKAALLDGHGDPAIVGDQLKVRETIDMSGLTSGGHKPLETRGTLRFGSAVIGNQFQLFDARLAADGEALVLYNCQVGGDILVGNRGTTTRLHGSLNANLCVSGGRLVFDALEIAAPGEAISARYAKIDREIVCYDLVADGSLAFDNCVSDGISFDQVKLARPAMPPVRPGLPEPYAQPEDVLLDLNFVTLRSDLRAEQLTLSNGNLRMIGAQIGGGVQLSRIAIDAGGRLAIVAQSARIARGMMIAGTPSEAAVILGEISVLSATIEDDLTFSFLTLGGPVARTRVTVRNARLGGGFLLNESIVHGELHASSIKVAGDFHVHSSTLANPGQVTCDLRGAEIGGHLQWATARRPDGGIACFLDGTVTADGASAGTMGWHELALRDQTHLAFTNMTIRQRIDVEHLVCEGVTQINFSGTTTPLLVDRFDGETDSWGNARLGLDNFSYDRLARPSGGNGDMPDAITKRRISWLERRFDPTSARPARHLAGVLRSQGLFEASRRMLMHAFAAEGDARSTPAGRGISRLFGFFFGHGLSGSRAAMTMILTWLVGTIGFASLETRHLLVSTETTAAAAIEPCDQSIDPSLYAIDVMIPLDLGEESRCRIGAAPGAQLVPARTTEWGWTLGGTVATARTLAVLYRLMAWLVLSLSIATWSGLFKRAGRE